MKRQYQAWVIAVAQLRAKYRARKDHLSLILLYPVAWLVLIFFCPVFAVWDWFKERWDFLLLLIVVWLALLSGCAERSGVPPLAKIVPADYSYDR